MDRNFFYIVVTIGGQKYFINRDMDYSDNFEDVLKFELREIAEDHILKHRLTGKNAEILLCIGAR